MRVARELLAQVRDIPQSYHFADMARQQRHGVQVMGRDATHLTDQVENFRFFLELLDQPENEGVRL